MAMWPRSPYCRICHRHCLPFRSESLGSIGADQLEAADVDSGEGHERRTRVQLDDDPGRGVRAQVDVAGQARFQILGLGDLDVLHVGESFAPQQLLGNVLGGQTDRRDLAKPDPLRLERRLGRGRAWTRAEEACRSRERHAPQSPVGCSSRQLFRIR